MRYIICPAVATALYHGATAEGREIGDLNSESDSNRHSNLDILLLCILLTSPYSTTNYFSSEAAAEASPRVDDDQLSSSLLLLMRAASKSKMDGEKRYRDNPKDLIHLDK